MEEALGLNLMEMDMRQFDPAIARWTSIDPVTHHSMSTYTGFDNNPVFWADPSGADSWKYTSNGVYRNNQTGEETTDYQRAISETQSHFGEESNDNNSGGCDDCSKCPETCNKNTTKNTSQPRLEDGVSDVTKDFLSSDTNTKQNNFSSVLMGVIILDTTTPDPTDVAIPKWLGYSIVLAGAAAYDATQRVYVTYTLTNTGTGQIYVGRTSGYGDPISIVNARYAGHHRRLMGYSNPLVDVAVQGVQGYPAIRGREQQLIDYHGGIGAPKVGNAIRGVSKINLFGKIYYTASSSYFGKIAPYTGSF